MAFPHFTSKEIASLQEYRRRELVAFPWDGEATNLVTTLQMRQMQSEGLAKGDFIVFDANLPHTVKFYKPHLFERFFQPVEWEAPEMPASLAVELTELAAKVLAAANTPGAGMAADEVLADFFERIGETGIAANWRQIKGLSPNA